MTRVWVCYIFMTYMIMAYVVMACIILASRHEYSEGVGLLYRYGLCSYGLYNHGLQARVQ